MEDHARRNSTNVRIGIGAAAAPAILASALWAALAAALQWTGTVQRLGDDVPFLGAFACIVALLAYGVDAEVRSVLDAGRASLLATGSALLFAASAVAPWIMLAALPPAVVLLAALCQRLLAARLSSAVAASPAGRRAAP